MSKIHSVQIKAIRQKLLENENQNTTINEHLISQLTETNSKVMFSLIESYVDVFS